MAHEAENRPVAPWYPPAGTFATKDANGHHLGYPGPDGRTLYYRGFPVGSAAEWDRIQRENPRPVSRK